MSDSVLTEVSDGIAVITINRPQARNAINGAVARGMAAAIDDLDARGDVGVLILTGAGGTFSAGMDLKGFLGGDTPVVPGRGFGGIVERPPVKPVIAAIEDYALRPSGSSSSRQTGTARPPSAGRARSSPRCSRQRTPWRGPPHSRKNAPRDGAASNAQRRGCLLRAVCVTRHAAR
jgi:hypothetical protein